jgi:hypothetical protein
VSQRVPRITRISATPSVFSIRCTSPRESICEWTRAPRLVDGAASELPGNRRKGAGTPRKGRVFMPATSSHPSSANRCSRREIELVQISVDRLSFCHLCTGKKCSQLYLCNHLSKGMLRHECARKSGGRSALPEAR